MLTLKPAQFCQTGIVNAVEVVNSFGGDDALMDFRRWVLSPDADAIKAAAKKGRGRGKKAAAAETGTSVVHSVDTIGVMCTVTGCRGCQGSGQEG